MEVKTKVPFTLANIKNCLCPSCAVQGKSTCVADKKKGLKATLAHNPLVSEQIPGLYCSSGTATCSGLDPDKECSCYSCPVYFEHKLADATPPCYYCQHGRAEL
ncbi:MAG: DUF2769 domain-containing protein [Chloroflexi bacterium]|nr:DUF2769 domain-containing protein [Chloroflexota bacterium]